MHINYRMWVSLHRKELRTIWLLTTTSTKDTYNSFKLSEWQKYREQYYDKPRDKLHPFLR